MASVKSQMSNGGYGYSLYNRLNPKAAEMWREDEASTTISQIQALRGARNAGFSVEVRTIHAALDYIVRSQDPKTGGFFYSIGVTPVKVSMYEDGRPTFAISAASLAVLNSLGTYKGPIIDRGISYLESFRPSRRQREPWYYFGHYYAAQVMHAVGGKKGYDWFSAINRELSARQSSDGGWPDDSTDTLDVNDSRILNTAWALQILFIYRGFLPIHER